VCPRRVGRPSMKNSVPVADLSVCHLTVSVLPRSRARTDSRVGSGRTRRRRKSRLRVLTAHASPEGWQARTTTLSPPGRFEARCPISPGSILRIPARPPGREVDPSPRRPLPSLKNPRSRGPRTTPRRSQAVPQRTRTRNASPWRSDLRLGTVRLRLGGRGTGERPAGLNRCRRPRPEGTSLDASSSIGSAPALSTSAGAGDPSRSSTAAAP
jgi:hypothetical protein